MKKGLVLEGGAMRGLFTAGVMDVFMENGIEFDGAVGVSAGAAFGCNYKSRQPGRVIRYNRRMAHDRRFAGLGSFLRTGNLYAAEFDYHILPTEIDIMDFETYRTNPMEFWYVCTDVRTGRPVYHRSEELTYEDLEWMRASASMPVASKIVRIGGYELLDGGISDSIPLRFFESVGYDRNVVVLTQPKNYVKQPNRLMPLIRVALRQYPATVRALANRHLRYRKQVRQVWDDVAAGRALVIQPDAPLEIHSVEHDESVMQRVYEEGRKAAEGQLEAVREFLGDEKA